MNPEKRNSTAAKAIALLLIACAGYVIWPYITVLRFYSALRAQNADAISEQIDFPSLRTSMKDQLNANMMKQVIEAMDVTDYSFAGLTTAFLPKMIESMVDAYVTPAGITQLLESDAFHSENQSAGQNTPSALTSERLKEIKYAFFINPTEFSLKTDDLDFVFQIRDWTWKLTDLKLMSASTSGMPTMEAVMSALQLQPRSEPVHEHEPEPVPEPENWVFWTDVSPIDDTTSYYLGRSAEEPVGVGFMRFPTLMIRYKERELDVYINFNTYLGSDSTEVIVRFGQTPASQEEWSLSTDGKAIFCPTDARTFVRQLLGNDQLVIRLTPFGESPITTTFNLTGLSEAIEPMQEALTGNEPPRQNEAAHQKQLTEQQAEETQARLEDAEVQRLRDEAEEARMEIERLRIVRQQEEEQQRSDQSLIQGVIANIYQDVRNNFNISGLPPGLECELLVRTVPGGEVVGVQISKSSGDEIFDRRAHDAVQKASPLPLPADSATFERLGLRQFSLRFKPQ